MKAADEYLKAMIVGSLNCLHVMLLFVSLSSIPSISIKQVWAQQKKQCPAIYFL